VTTPGPILPGTSPGLLAGVTAAPVVLAGSQPPVTLEYQIQDVFSDLFSDTFGVVVLLTTVAALPPSSP
jgi:hypothetical protein